MIASLKLCSTCSMETSPKTARLASKTPVGRALGNWLGNMLRKELFSCDGIPLGSTLDVNDGKVLGATVGYLKTVLVDSSTLNAPIAFKNFVRLTGTLGLRDGELLGDSVGSAFRDGAKLDPSSLMDL
eukprot:CAMPEP_0201133552 /NCGR_PEP_ID=MMETSP0850-20130426/49169_1 /ASSEMBLY_ACC=CAM_ASM_000622 /TAXON_ID=183588 /ORGANISM="Pseudo-nitzschia fraudulenta, Strain WWA7" /LENGTH=127 /DNA_ID=CAMNT_0047404229 /DNA_START=193 /DNA_END=572 /DNA_ORIENTATION=-